MPSIHELLMPDEQRKTCDCRLCEEGRFVRRIQGLLPEAEANELSDWYNAIRDEGEMREHSLYHLRELVSKCGEYVDDLMGKN